MLSCGKVPQMHRDRDKMGVLAKKKSHGSRQEKAGIPAKTFGVRMKFQGRGVFGIMIFP